jgi:hypothetical protein
MLKKPSPKLFKAVADYNYINEIPERKRTQEQNDRVVQAADELRENWEDLFVALVGTEMESIEAEFSECAREREGVIYPFGAFDELFQKTRVPKVPTPVTKEGVDEAMAHLYQRMTTCYGALEELEPALNRWINYEKRIKMIVKGIHSYDKEWKSDTAFELAYPSEIYRKVRYLAEYTEAFKLRLAALTNAKELLSRLITLHTEAPTGEFTRYGESSSLPNVVTKQSGSIGTVTGRFSNR